MPRVTILNRVVCDYRRTFHLELRRLLESRGVELTLIGGAPRPSEFLIDDLQGCHGVRGENLHFLGKPYWTRGAVRAAQGADLVVLEQANAALHNYWLMLSRGLFQKPRRTAFWGHGYSVDASGRKTIRTRLKTHLAMKVDWWFAYTDLTTHLLGTWGFPPDRITTVNNAIDTEALRDNAFQGTEAERADLLCRLFPAPSASGPMGVYCGRLLEGKQIPFLLESVAAIHGRLPEFRFALIGDGPLAPAVAQFQRENPWFRWVGSDHGPERARVLSLADVWLTPGNLGLAVLDAFSLGIPVVTKRDGKHGPEIAYLEDGINGILTPDSVGGYAEAVINLLADPVRLRSMRAAAEAAGRRYTSKEMAQRFADGILDCLGAVRA